MTTFLIILVIINIILTVFYANKLENTMRMLKDSTADQIILSETRIKIQIVGNKWKNQNDYDN